MGFNDVKFERGAILIQKAGTELGCSCVEIAKALLIYHRSRHVTAIFKYSDLTIASAVLFTSVFSKSVKYEYEDIVLIFHKYHCSEKPDREKDKPSEDEIYSMKEDFSKIQAFILNVVEFTSDFVVAYTYAGRYLVIFREQPELNKILHHFQAMVWKFISQFYLSKRCLQYSAQAIALGCIILAARVLCVDLSTIPNWTQELAVTLDNKKKEDILDELIHVLDIVT